MAILHHLSKPKSRQDIVFEEDLAMDPDGWFIRVKHVNKKDGSTASSSCIILKDIEQWLSMYNKDGYIELT